MNVAIGCPNSQETKRPRPKTRVARVLSHRESAGPPRLDTQPMPLADLFPASTDRATTAPIVQICPPGLLNQAAAGSIPIDGCCADRRRRVRAQNMRPRTLRWRIPFPRWPYRPQHRWPGGDIMAPFSAFTGAQTNSGECRLLSALQLGTARRGGREIEHSAFQISFWRLCPLTKIESRHKSDLSWREQRAQPRVVLQGQTERHSPSWMAATCNCACRNGNGRSYPERGSTLAVVNRGMRWPGWSPEGARCGGCTFREGPNIAVNVETASGESHMWTRTWAWQSSRPTGCISSYRASGTARLVGDLAGRRFAEGTHLLSCRSDRSR